MSTTYGQSADERSMIGNKLWTILFSSPRYPGLLDSMEHNGMRVDILSRGPFYPPLRIEYRPESESPYCSEKRVVADEILVKLDVELGFLKRLQLRLGLRLRGLKVAGSCGSDRKTYLLRRSKLWGLPFFRVPPKPLVSWVERASRAIESSKLYQRKGAVVEEHAVFSAAAYRTSDALRAEQWDHDLIRTDKAHDHIESTWPQWKDCDPETVAVIDSGVDHHHEDLWIDERSRSFLSCRCSLLYLLYCWIFGHRRNEPMDEWHSHGTGCAAPIAAKVGNSKGIIGVGLHAKVLALKFMGPDGIGTAADAVKALDYARKLRIPVILLAWGGSCGSTCLKEALQRAAEDGILVVAAAGNRGEQLEYEGPYYYPACHKPYIDNMLVVAGTEKRSNQECRVRGSNCGVRFVNIAAPGLQCKVTRAGHRLHRGSPGTSRYGYFSGTSISAALVAGACALVRLRLRLENGCDPSPTAQEVARIVLDGACQLEVLKGEVENERRLDVLRCVTHATCGIATGRGSPTQGQHGKAATQSSQQSSP